MELSAYLFDQQESTPFYKTKLFKISLIISLYFLIVGLAYAGGDGGALGPIWTEFKAALTGAPGKILAAAMLLAAAYFSVVKPNPGLACVSFVMMMILANGETIISGWLTAGVPL